MKPSVIILTYNSEDSIGQTLQSVASLTDDIHVVDSYSIDRSREIALCHGAKIVQHPFENYGAQRNWAISALPFKYKWQLHLDADERLTGALVREISDLGDDPGFSGFYIPRELRFLGRPIRHGGMFPTWHMRLFKSGAAECETRKYDQHFRVTAGKTAELRGYMVDDVRMSLSEWTVRHNRWSDAEVEEHFEGQHAGRIAGKAAGNKVEKKRFWRGIYNRGPLFLRAGGLFFYRYIVRLGFLDGATGLIFYVLQTFWFRFLVDAKLFEQRLAQESALKKSSSEPAPAANAHANSRTND